MTLLSRFGQEHQTVLVGHVAATEPAYRQLASHLAATLGRHGADAAHALLQTEATVYGMVHAQAQLMAFLDDFHLLAAIFVVLAPFVFLMHRPRHEPH